MVSAQRQVTVQEGPLYRTEGSHITIWCNVSGYQGPSEQNFQWSIYLPSAPEREVQIVSTVDSSFPYAIYTQRVRGGKIFVERVQGNSALLHITDLQARDAGEYECHTPNTDERYFGSYSAKMNLVGKEMLFPHGQCQADSLLLPCAFVAYQYDSPDILENCMRKHERPRILCTFVNTRTVKADTWKVPVQILRTSAAKQTFASERQK